jgi:hypothetical protein
LLWFGSPIFGPDSKGGSLGVRTNGILASNIWRNSRTQPASKFPKIDLSELGKSAWRKLEIARRLRKETTMSLSWIAETRRTGSVAYLLKLIKKKAWD